MFDFIVVGSGMSGGWAAKELCEQGFKVLVIERGRYVEHRGSEYTDMVYPWESKNFGLVPENLLLDHDLSSVGYAMTPDNVNWFTRFDDLPYSYPEDKPFVWIRAHNLGGRSLLWSRQTYRMSQRDFEANAVDGHGVPWPIGYEDLKPWYDYVDTFAGIAGQAEGLEQVPDGVFQPPFELKAPEKVFKERMEAAFPGRNVIHNRCAHLTSPTEDQLGLGRVECQKRSFCEKGCAFGAFFSSLSATLPAAERTGNLTIETDKIVSSLMTDPQTGQVTGVRAIDANSRASVEYRGRAVFLCASTFGTLSVLFNTRSDNTPSGLGNEHDLLGRYITDHIGAGGASGTMPGLDDRYYEGRTPSGFYIPRFRNISEPGNDYTRGGGYQCGASREDHRAKARQAGFGKAYKDRTRTPGKWKIRLSGFGEMLPRWENRMELHPTKTDMWGLPLVHFDVSISDNERNMSNQLTDDAVAMLAAVGAQEIERREGVATPGTRIHEMGGAVMGDDPTRSVTNRYNQLHVADNVFVTDGACFPSGGCQNPSISYMAMTVRAAHNAADMMREGVL